MNCKIEDCEGTVHVKKEALCRAHYLRLKKYGSADFYPKAKLGKDANNFKHGGFGHALFKTWTHMLDRCQSPKCSAYKYYGSRGISVCDRWQDFWKFVEDMGERPKGKTLERIDNGKGYSPDNCVWADNKTQARNRRNVKLSLDAAKEIRSLPRRAKNGRGKGYSREEIAEAYGVSVATVKKVLSGEHWA